MYQSSSHRPRHQGGGSTRFHSARPAQRGSFSHQRSTSFRSGPVRGQARGNNRFAGKYIDPSKFIKKAVITEEVENFVPEHKFVDFAVSEKLKLNITRKGYQLPTPIQDKAIPHILRGEDVVGIANTGTGKTAAFLIPLIEKVSKLKQEKVLIMVPTRELALQIDEELKAFVRGFGIFSVCCVGGANIRAQLAQLRHHNNFIIGTPGRLKDLVERRAINLTEFKTVVLDEADRMLDMGFINDMKFMLGQMPSPRHTLFFSATLSPEIERLIHSFLRQPARISVKTQETAANVEQDVVRVSGANKFVKLLELLRQADFNRVLVFARTKHGSEKLSRDLKKEGISTESIHGNKSQSQRQRALAAFKQGLTQVLVATDVAARGLDISDISHVINYDIPATYEDYIHRIGRTGRGNKRGKALTFVE